MSLQGLPDFYKPIPGNGYQIFYPYENAGDYIILPDLLEISDRPDDDPDFRLDLVRGENPNLLPSPYGILDFRLQPHYAIAEALTLLRQQHSEAMISPAIFASGFLRLYAIGQTDEIPADLRVPMPLTWNGLGNARFTLKLAPTTALLLKSSIEGNALLLSADAEMELEGVAPRLPLQVRFNANHLLSLLASLGNEQRQIARSEILRFFRQDISLLPFEVVGTVSDRETLAETLTDWVRVYFGKFIPSPNDDAKPYLALIPAPSDDRSIEWDLSQPLRVPRPLVLNLNPLAAAQKIVQAQGIDAIARTTIIPAFSTGILPVSVSANLPAHRPGVIAMGVTLRAAPYLPYRPQAVIATTELTPPEDQARLLLRLAASEPPQYTVMTFVVVSNSQGAKQFKSDEMPHSGDTLYLNLDDFPVTFLPMEALRSLLEIASIRGVCRCLDQGILLEQSFVLNLEQPAIALCLPQTAAGATLDITAQCRSTDKILRLNSLPAKPLKLGLHSFREYGPQTVQIDCNFNDATSLIAIDLLPEDRPVEEMQVLSFTLSRPHREWTYLARSPFQVGYRYRLHSEDSTLPFAWSAVLPPFERLTISTLTLEINHDQITNGL